MNNAYHFANDGYEFSYFMLFYCATMVKLVNNNTSVDLIV